MVVTTSVNLATKISLFVQALTGIVGFQALTFKISPADGVLKQVLGLELFVQGIEFLFYLTFLSVFSLTTLTQKRYHDWFISTPVMLFTTSLYFYYVNNIENKPDEAEKEEFDMHIFARRYWKPLLLIVILNFGMLLFGYLAELNVIGKWPGFWLGTASLIGSFATIYNNFGYQSQESRTIFWIMFSLWSLYGGAFLLPAVPKNISYTALDIFSKNFFGLFLTYVISKKAIQ
jgi:hypothetical protein